MSCRAFAGALHCDAVAMPWACATCTVLNDQESSLACFVCATPRHDPPAAPPPAPAAPAPEEEPARKKQRRTEDLETRRENVENEATQDENTQVDTQEYSLSDSQMDACGDARTFASDSQTEAGGDARTSDSQTCALDSQAGTEPDAPRAPRRVVVEAWKACHDWDGEPEETDDEDEDSPVVRISAEGDTVRVVAMGDLHRHHNDKSIFVGAGAARRRVTLAEWFDVAAPDDVGLVIFAGDLGLEQNDELARETGRGIDRRARGVLETGEQKERASVDEWAALFEAITAARPRCHVVVIGGNHDGLLCDDDDCVSCKLLDAMPFEKTERRRPWGRTAREAVDAVERVLVGGRDRVHLLRDSFVDVAVPLVAGGFGDLRVLGSPLTPRVQTNLGADPQECLACHNTLLARETSKTYDRWRALLAHADRPSVVVVHGPPFGIMDIVERQRRVGCAQLARAMERKPVALCVFGHVHAKQHASEDGYRLCISRDHPGTLFCNAASETGTPMITGFRLMEKSGKYDDVPMLRPPTILEIPLSGFAVGSARDYWERP